MRGGVAGRLKKERYTISRREGLVQSCWIIRQHSIIFRLLDRGLFEDARQTVKLHVTAAPHFTTKASYASCSLESAHSSVKTLCILQYQQVLAGEPCNKGKACIWSWIWNLNGFMRILHPSAESPELLSFWLLLHRGRPLASTYSTQRHSADVRL